MATYFHLPTYLPTQEEVIRAKRLINSRAFRRLFPSTLCPPISQFVRNIDSITRYCSLQIPVCYTAPSPPPFFLLFDPVSFNPSFLPVSSSTTRMDTSPPQRIRFPRSNRNWVADLAPQKEREGGREKEIIIAFHREKYANSCRYAAS